MRMVAFILIFMMMLHIPLSALECDVMDLEKWSYGHPNGFAFDASYINAGKRYGPVVMLLRINCTRSTWDGNLPEHPLGCFSLNREVHKVLTIGCPLNALYLISDLYPELTANVTELEIDRNPLYNGHLPGPIKRFVRLESLELKAFTFARTLDDNWPSSLRKLKIISSRFAHLPNLMMKSVLDLKLLYNTEMQTVSQISEYKNLSSLTIDGCVKLETLPDRLFVGNAKLTSIRVKTHHKLVLSHNTLEGLLSLEDLSLEGVNLIPRGFFSHVPMLKKLTWISGGGLNCEPRLQFPDQMLTSDNQQISHFEYKQERHDGRPPCNISIHKNAFSPVQFTTVRSLSIQTTLLGTSELLENFCNRFHNLTSLDLRSNRLEEMKRSFFQSLRHLKLAGNPWSCHCTNLQAVLSLKEIISDYDQLTFHNCSSGGDLRHLAPQEAYESLDCKTFDSPLGPTPEVYATIGICGFLVAVAIAIVAIVRGRKYSTPFEADLTYDAFLSYAEADREIAVAIRSKLMNDSRFSVAIHDVNFVPGVPIRQNMITNIECSRRFLAILTANYMNSANCVDEFVIATDCHKRIIAVVTNVEDLTNIENVIIRSFVRTKTYLKFEEGSSRFWRRLCNAMPRKRASEENGEEHVLLNQM